MEEEILPSVGCEAWCPLRDACGPLGAKDFVEFRERRRVVIARAGENDVFHFRHFGQGRFGDGMKFAVHDQRACAGVVHWWAASRAVYIELVAVTVPPALSTPK